ncbi:hypothetical protein HZB94_03610 [Candidatus Falkowbacteria bacterium]|nr:hypothetical protein [Candidatus Falkowbacteria bacterium]
MASNFTQILPIFWSKLKKAAQFAKFLFLPRHRAHKVVLIFIIVFAIFFISSGVYAAAGGDLAIPGLDWLFSFLARLLWGIAYMLGWIAMKLFALLIVFCSYNDFVTSAAVNKGWVLTRDISNLFFVLVLLVIAFCQILHVEKYKLQQILPTLLIAAVLVNFSKLICALMIDFAQVVMMTFVNGFAATAGANLINGLGLTKVMQMDSSSVDSASKLTGLEVFLAMSLGIFVILVVIIVTFFILLLIVLRIVSLWVLIVLSPFAFVLEAVPVGGLKEKAAKWWSTFGRTVAIGPIMAFFLWLSLAVMANPEETIKIESDAIEAKSKGAVTTKMSYINNLAQSAIGLAMLMAGLMAAQEAGGIIGGAAGKMKAWTETAAKGVAGKMSGYSAVATRAKAVYGGYAAARKTAIEAKMASYAGFGAKTFAKKEGAVGVAKEVAAAPIIAGAKATRVPAIAAKLAGKVAGGIGGFKEKVAGSKVGKWVAETSAGVGTMEEITVDRIRKGEFERKRKEGGELLAARGIKDEKDLETAMMDDKQPKNLRAAAAMKLAEDGKLKDEKQVEAARKLVKGDRDGEKILQDNIEKHNAHLAMDISIDKPDQTADERAKNQENRDKMAEKIRTGKVDIAGQGPTALQNADLLQIAMQALGPKILANKLGDASKKNAANRTAVNSGVSRLAAAEHKRIEAMPKGNPDGNPEEKAQHEAQATERKNIQSMVANVTNNLNLAFGKRNENGEAIDTDGKKIEIGDEKGKAIAIDDSQADAMKSHIARMSPKQLAGIDLQEDALSHIAQHVKKTQLENLASSNEENAIPNLEKIIDKAMDKNQELIAKIASSEKVMGAISSQLTDRIKHRMELAAEAEKRAAKSKKT